MNELIIIKRIERDEQEINQVIDELNLLMNNSVFRGTAEAYYTYNLKANAYVYFLKNEDNGYIKIGCTKNLKSRMSTLESGLRLYGYEPHFKLIKMVRVSHEFMYEAEKELHEYFSSKHYFGEWFKISSQEIDDFYDGCEIQDEYPDNYFDMCVYTETKFKSLANPFIKTITGDTCSFVNDIIHEFVKIISWDIDTRLSIKFDGKTFIEWMASEKPQLLSITQL